MDMHSDFNVSSHNDTSIEHEIGFPFIQTPAAIAIAVSILDGVMILFGGTINLAVIVTIVSHYHTLKTMDMFILNLCLSDFASSIFYQPLIITRLLARSKLSSLHNGFLKMATFTCLLADCAALFLVTFDKYLSIRFPLRYYAYVSKQKVVVIITCAWIIATAIGLIFALCDQVALIAGILYAVLIIIMFIITTGMQVASFFIAKRHEQRIQKIRTVVDNTRSEEIKPETTQFSVNNSKPANPFSSKAARTVTLLTMVFIMSWLPQIVLNVYFMITFDTKTFFGLIYLFVAFQQLHVCINPFIYVFRTQYIRNKFFGARNEIGYSSGASCSKHD